MGKHVSRAKRASDVALNLEADAEKLRQIFDNEDLDDAAAIAEAKAIVDRVDFSELECLRDEMSESRDNMEEHFSATDRFQRISECADNLDNIVGELESMPSVETREDIDEAAQKLDDAVSEMGCLDFPGMYG